MTTTNITIMLEQMDDLLLILLVIAVPLSVLLGLLGPVIIWRRMAYFGDSLAHSSLLGLSVGIFGGINQDLSIFIMALLFALILWYLKSVKLWANDSLLGLLAHSSLGLGLLVFSLLNVPQSVLFARMFGDILSVDWFDFAVLSLVAILALLALWKFTQNVILVIISEELAQAEGVNVQAYNIGIMVFIALIIALASKIVGILLVGSLLIIPAMTARLLVRSPAKMLLASCLLTLVACWAGILLSLQFDITLSPVIVAVGVGLFVLALIKSIIIK